MTIDPLPMRRRRFVAAGAALSLSAALAPLARASARRAEAAAPPLLASVYTGQIEPSRCLVSEKYDGVRALWDGQRLRHRSGRDVAAPAAWLAALPSEPLDGELWLGRNRFDELSALVRRSRPDAAEWRPVRYMVFELPGAPGPFSARAARIVEIAAAAPASPLVAVAQVPGTDRQALQRQLAATVAAGGEGLMLHVAAAPWLTGRGDALMKLKPWLDAEARVAGHRPGRGRYLGRLGALELEGPNGRFLVGSGLDDAERAAPPPIGSSVTYRYRGLTPAGTPRFATFWRRDPGL